MPGRAAARPPRPATPGCGPLLLRTLPAPPSGGEGSCQAMCGGSGLQDCAGGIRSDWCRARRRGGGEPERSGEAVGNSWRQGTLGWLLQLAGQLADHAPKAKQPLCTPPSKCSPARSRRAGTAPPRPICLGSCSGDASTASCSLPDPRAGSEQRDVLVASARAAAGGRGARRGS